MTAFRDRTTGDGVLRPPGSSLRMRGGGRGGQGSETTLPAGEPKWPAIRTENGHRSIPYWNAALQRDIRLRSNVPDHTVGIMALGPMLHFGLRPYRPTRLSRTCSPRFGAGHAGTGRDDRSECAKVMSIDGATVAPATGARRRGLPPGRRPIRLDRRGLLCRSGLSRSRARADLPAELAVSLPRGDAARARQLRDRQRPGSGHLRGPRRGRRVARLLQRVQAPRPRAAAGRRHVRSAITCPYHAWVYDLDGRLHRARRSEHDRELRSGHAHPARHGAGGGVLPPGVREPGPGRHRRSPSSPAASPAR